MMDHPPVSVAAAALTPPIWLEDPELTPRPCDEARLDAADYTPIELAHGDDRLPVLLSCPHAGRDYPVTMLEAASCSLDAMRGLEDFGVDQLVHGVASEGITCMVNKMARAYCDVNRPADALDTAMFNGPVAAAPPSRHVKSGYGTLPKLSAARTPLYSRHLPATEAGVRLARAYTPYHEMLTAQIAHIRALHGRAYLLDLHSMPGTDRLRRPLPDIVLGDCLGTTLNRPTANVIEQYFSDCGLTVGWNHPYSGGYITRQTGRQNSAVQSLQIEVNRHLYMVPGQLVMDPDGTARMTQVLEGLAIYLANMLDGDQL